FHCPAEHDALFELLGDRVGDKLSIGFRLANFLDIDVHRHAQQALKVGLQVLDVFAAFADHHARTCRVNGDAGVLGRTLDGHETDRSALVLPLQVLANTNVFGQHAAESLIVGVPTPGPVAIYREADPNRVYFLA